LIDEELGHVFIQGIELMEVEQGRIKGDVGREGGHAHLKVLELGLLGCRLKHITTITKGGTSQNRTRKKKGNKIERKFSNEVG